MKTNVDRVDETTVELTVEVEPERVKKAFDKAAKELAKQVDVKGFRPGKAPRRLIEKRFGEGAIAQQALEPALNEYYAEAMQEAELLPVAPPEIDPESMTFDEEEGCRFTATIPVRPEFDAPDHTGISVPYPIWDVTDEDVEDELRELRDRFAEVDVVERAASTGDYVTIDLEFAVDGEVQEEQGVEDAMYEVGSGGVTPALDEQLEGASAGDVLEYTDTLPDEYPELGGQDAEFTVTVKDVRAKTLPKLDDDFALTASEYDTMDELRQSIRDQQLRTKIMEAQHQARSRVLEAYLALTEVPVPPQMVDQEVQNRIQRVEQQAAQYEVDVDALYEAEGTTREEFEEQARENAQSSVKATLVLDQLAEDLEIEVTDQDVNQEIARHAQQNQVSPQQIAEILQREGSVQQLVGDIVRRKTIDAIVEEADLDGAPSDDVLIELGLKPDPDAEVPQDKRDVVEQAVAQTEDELAEADAVREMAEESDSDESDGEGDSEGSAAGVDSVDSEDSDDSTDEEE